MTNRAIAKYLGVTARQVSKAWKRGWLWINGKQVDFKAIKA
jgi:hypothetical protein